LFAFARHFKVSNSRGFMVEMDIGQYNESPISNFQCPMTKLSGLKAT
jgi:hypothetical protein